MLRIDIIAPGRMRPSTPYKTLWQDYEKQIAWPLKLIEIEGKNATEEREKILSRLTPGAYVIALDERGTSLKSTDFAKTLEKLQNDGTPLVQFILGGADGLGDDIRAKAHRLISFGQQTWPHMMARIMLIEQIYRAQQILKGHPYHRE